MVKRKKHILTFVEEINFDLIGICSHHSDYRLVWNINQNIGLKLVKVDSYQFVHKKESYPTEHSMYEFLDEKNKMSFHMIKNKHDGQFLIPEKPSIDYFLFLCDNNAIELDVLIKKLKTTNSILGVYQFYPEEIASAQNIELR